MGLFNRYQKIGKGVAKNQPRKKPFFKFWEIFAGKFWKLITLNFIYLLFCVPIVTFGPATAALTHVMRKFYLEDSIFVYSEFVAAFKKNFKQSLAVGIVDVLFIALGVYTLNFYVQQFTAVNLQDTQTIILLALSIAALVYVFMMHFYIYEQIVALNLRMGQIVKNSMLLTVAGLGRNVIAMLTALVLISAIVLFFPYSVFALPFVPFAWISFTSVFCTYPVIQKTIINPFYEAKGEVNPELKKYMTDDDGEEAVFEDKGGQEEEVRIALNDKKNTGHGNGGSVKVAPKGKVIR